MIPPFVILAGENDLRVQLFQQALQKQGLPLASLVTYSELMDSPEILENTLKQQTSILRIDSPGRDLIARARLLQAGIGQLKKANKHYLDEAAIRQGLQDKGRIMAPHQCHAGFAHVMRQVQEQLMRQPQTKLMNHPAEIIRSFDKFQCQQFFLQQGVSVPEPLGVIKRYEQLRESMQKHRMPRVFIKLKHGSAASGIIALETSRGRVQIKTTVEGVKTSQGDLLLYNSRKIHHSRDESYIKQLVDSLCKMEVQVERWIPKAWINGYNIDLRILLIAGKAHHRVLRMSKSPMTNLHLLNRRGDISMIRDKMPTNAWDSLIHSCEKVAGLFPKSLYIALDIAVAVNFGRHYILEVNAFGDLLKNVEYQGLSPQEAEIAQLKNDNQYLAI